MEEGEEEPVVDIANNNNNIGMDVEHPQEIDPHMQHYQQLDKMKFDRHWLKAFSESFHNLNLPKLFAGTWNIWLISSIFIKANRKAYSPILLSSSRLFRTLVVLINLIMVLMILGKVTVENVMSEKLAIKFEKKMNELKEKYG